MSGSKYRIDRRAALGLAGALPTLALVPGAAVRAQSLDRVSYQTNWRAQAEHGGFYQAAAAGIYRRHGIEAEIRMGGPQQSPTQLLVAGGVDAVMSGGFETVRFAQEDLPFLAVAAIFQKDPQVLICHAGAGNDSLPALRGKPILAGATARTTYWPFLRARFGFADEQIRPYTFSMAPFLADRRACQQGYATSEPFALRQAGVTPVVHLLADAGLRNYATTITTSRRFVEDRAEVMQRFVTATLEGWAEYLKGGPGTEAANALILRDNPDMDLGRIADAVRVMNEDGIVLSGDALQLGIGAMTDDRWQAFYRQMADAGVFPHGVDVRKAYTLQFVNKGVGRPA